MLDHVPKANHIRTINQLLSSKSRYGATEKAATIPRMKDNATDTVTVYFHVSFLYHGLAAFIMLVITVEATIRIRIRLVMLIRLEYKIYYLSFGIIFTKFQKQ